MADKTNEILLDALKQALTEPGEHRLYKSGKLDGLFAQRTGVPREAAEKAVRDGLLEIVRSETKGKTTTEWVRATAKAVEFVHREQSPVETLRDLQTVLQVSSEQIPLWLVDMKQRLVNLGNELTEEAKKWTHRLEALASQVAEALERAEASGRSGPEPTDEETAWGQQTVGYLERRRESGASGDCPLPELFSALHERYPELSVPGFHERLLRLQDRRQVRLVPFPGKPSDIPEPEYALPEGTRLYYYVSPQAS